MKIADLFASYAEHVIPENAGKLQKQEVRRAFYAGFDSAMMILLKAASLPEQDVMKILKDIDLETKKFVEDVKKGLA